MSDVILRRTASGWMVAVPFARERHGKPAIGTRHRKHYASPSDAVKAAMAQLTAEAPRDSLSERARPSSVENLKPQARKALRLIIERKGMTRLEAMYYGIGNLPARVGEIRAEFGADCIETCPVPDGEYSRYVWRGPTEIQLEMEAA